MHVTRPALDDLGRETKRALIDCVLPQQRRGIANGRERLAKFLREDGDQLFMSVVVRRSIVSHSHIHSGSGATGSLDDVTFSFSVRYRTLRHPSA
ncbi:MAG TPA: hypothetical protein VHQ88_06560, partial [Burkholderiales bacterium]|nr:hypothetical protein [Burkholderiales bacterium]